MRKSRGSKRARERERERKIKVGRVRSLHCGKPLYSSRTYVGAWVTIAVEHEDRLFTSSPSGIPLIATRHGLTALDTQPTLPFTLSFNLHSNRPHVLACPYTNTCRFVNFFPLSTFHFTPLTNCTTLQSTLQFRLTKETYPLKAARTMKSF